MARFPRLVLPGYPYHVTQRGNRRQQTFFQEGDYALYRDLLAEAAMRVDEDGLRRTFADAHRRYTGYINARHRWTGHLWQGRFGAVVIDEAYLGHAMRYVALNPVRAKLVRRAKDRPWSSVRAHLVGQYDALVRVAPALDRYGDFATFRRRCRG